VSGCARAASSLSNQAASSAAASAASASTTDSKTGTPVDAVAGSKPIPGGVTDSLRPTQPLVSPTRCGKKHVDSAVRDFRPYAPG